MEGPPSKQRKTIADELLKQKAQNLPLLCVESICKFTPSSKLIRLYSKAVPLPGAFWNYGLETVLSKRGPLSVTDDLSYHRSAAPADVFDATGANVASVRRPDAFRFSPVRELIESVALRAYAFPQNNTLDGMQVHVAQGEALLSCLPNVTELTLSFSYEGRGLTFKEEGLLEPAVKPLLSRLRSMTFRVSFGYMDAYAEKQLNWALSGYLCNVAVPQMNSLQLLDLPQELVGYVAHRASSGDSTFGRPVKRVLSGLSSLAAWQIHLTVMNLSDMLRFISVHCRHVSALSVLVEPDFKDYLTAFRALPSLASLGLYFRVQPGMVGPTCKESGAIGSVLDLRFFIYNPHSGNLVSCAIAIASLFPNAKALAFQVDGEDGRPELQLAAALCTRRVLPAVEKLSIFYPGVKSDCEYLADFIGNSNLPEALDFSQIVFASLFEDSTVLTEIYRAMQCNATKSLLMRGPVPESALSQLKSYVAVNDEHGKVTAWKDRDLGEQRRFFTLQRMPQQTDFKIVGKKTAGSLKGEPFTIRVMHQFAKRFHVFDFDN